MCLSRMWEHATSISATLKSILNADASCTVCVCKPVWECVLMDIVLFFCVSACVWQFADLFGARTDWLIQLCQISHSEEVSLSECCFHHLSRLQHKKKTSLSPSRMHQNIHVLISALVWKTKKKNAGHHNCVCVCVSSRMTVIYRGGSFAAHPPPPPSTLLIFSSFTLFLSLNLPGLSSHVWIWDVNDRTEGSKGTKVARFSICKCQIAMLEMQISRQMPGSCRTSDAQISDLDSSESGDAFLSGSVSEKMVITLILTYQS